MIYLHRLNFVGNEKTAYGTRTKRKVLVVVKSIAILFREYHFEFLDQWSHYSEVCSNNIPLHPRVFQFKISVRSRKFARIPEMPSVYSGILISDDIGTSFLLARRLS